MIVRCCDVCKKPLQRSYVLSVHDVKPGGNTHPAEGVKPPQDCCLYCLITMLDKLDDRPRAAND